MLGSFEIPACAKDVEVQNFINGEWVAPISGAYLKNYDPSTGREAALIPDSTAADVNNAVLAAKNAFSGWSSTPAVERAAILNRIADMIDENSNILAILESQDQGKPIASAATFDIPECSLFFRQYARYAIE
ncbi:hypothetical protein H4R20_005814, partial [Coemansia guatemalensis]